MPQAANSTHRKYVPTIHYAHLLITPRSFAYILLMFFVLIFLWIRRYIDNVAIQNYL